jgi:hypothetical protein
MNSPPAIALSRVLIDSVDHQHDHAGAEQIVVERAEELGDENRQESARSQQVNGVVHQSAPPLCGLSRWSIGRPV